MLLEVSGETWNNYLISCNENSLFANLSFLQYTAACFNVKVSFYLWKEDNGAEILGFSVFSADKAIKAPTNFHSFLVVERDAPNEVKEDAFFQAIQILKRKFNSITLKLLPEFKYIDTYSKLGFEINDRYTYEKRLDNLFYSRNITRIVNNGAQKNYMVTIACDFEKSFTSIWESNKRYFLTADKSRYFQFFFKLFWDGLVDVFDVYKNEIYVTSLLTIKDVKQQKVYTYLIGIPNKEMHLEAQTMLYRHCMSYYKTEGYLFCDMCGANLPNVAKYKAKFKGDLKLYRQVVYHSGFRVKLINYVKKLFASSLLKIKN